MIKDDLLKVLGIIVLSAVAGYIFLPSLVFNLPFILIFALIFFPIASAKYNREILQIYQYPRSRHIPSLDSISSHGQGHFLQCEVVESYKRYSKKGLMQWFRK